MTILVDGELVLYGFVGEDYWDEGFTDSEVLDALAEVGRETDITVRINSGGGYTDAGIAIYNALVAHKGKVSIVVDAMAASAASLIAMAGDTITMRAGSMMMLHLPSGGSYGDEFTHRKQAEIQTKLGDLMASIYAERSGDDFDAVRAELKDELWLKPEEAVERGYATDVVTAKSGTVSAFDYRIYAQSPKKLVAMAKKKDWSFEAVSKTAASAATTEAKEKEPPTMANTPPAVDPAPQTETAADVKARIKAITEDDAAKGNEGLAKHLAFDTDLPADDAIAALKASAPAAPAPNNEKVEDRKGYQARRSAASDLAQPSGSGQEKPKATINTGGIYASRIVKKGV